MKKIFGIALLSGMIFVSGFNSVALAGGACCPTSTAKATATPAETDSTTIVEEEAAVCE
ncbi:MAG: hypothetical protein HY586_03795 [Candidatus Omnitrophica bacterium]|nr:hypothetical protein [Candidatus Omnitrophota bacterium]